LLLSGVALSILGRHTRALLAQRHGRHPLPVRPQAHHGFRVDDAAKPGREALPRRQRVQPCHPLARLDSSRAVRGSLRYSTLLTNEGQWYNARDLDDTSRGSEWQFHSR